MVDYKIKLLIGLMSIGSILTEATGQKKSVPIFSRVEYQGDDQVYKGYPLEKDEFYNPIFQGCYPDPAITRKGVDYYLLSCFRECPFFTPKTWFNWTQIGHVLDRVSQLEVNHAGISRGVYAPGITYNPHNDMFYMITTLVSGSGNIIVKTKDPSLGWSDRSN